MTVTDFEVPVGARLVPDADAATYRRLLRAAPSTNRCPIWIGGAARRYTEPDRVVPDAAAAITAVDAEQTLDTWWPGPCRSGCRCLDPFLGEFPGLVRSGRADRARSAATVRVAGEFAEAASKMASLVLVDAARPADVPAALGWTDACNYFHQNLIGLCSVLRRWEDRFGAVLTWLNGATLLLSVAAPPTSVVKSQRVAAEHFAFCPDQIDPQDGRDPFSPRTYARTIRHGEVWRFWWD